MVFKTGQQHKQEIHYTVGAIIERDGKYLLIDRKKLPLGFACVAGHIDEGETPEEALVREVKEESNLVVVSHKHIAEEFLPWNECARGVRGHYWYVYRVETRGKIQKENAEAKSIGWYTKEEIRELSLEPSWGYWFKKFGVI